MGRRVLRGDYMAQLIGVLFSFSRSLSKRMVRHDVERRPDLAAGRGQRSILIMLGCVLLVTTAFAGMSDEVRRFDHNNDGKPGQWEHYRDGVLLRVEVDRNRDGRVDEWTFYEDGKPVRAEFDTDGDGKVNQREFYNVQRQVERVEVDSDGDGQAEQWHTFQDGQLQEIAL